MPNEPEALVIAYYLRAAHAAGALVTIADVNGQRIAQLKGPAAAGVNRVQWNMRGGAAEGASGGTGRGGASGGPLMPPGDYRVTVEAAGEQQSTVGRIRAQITSDF